MKQSIISIAVFVILSSFAGAIGISPSIVELDYTPGEEITIPFSVFNWGGAPIDIMVFYGNELSGYVTSPNQTFEVPGSDKKIFEVKLLLPYDIPIAGPKTLSVFAQEFKKGGKDGIFQVTTGIEAWVKVNIPYPGQYPEMSFSVEDAKQGSKTTAHASIINKGNSSLDQGRILYEVYDGDKQIFSNAVTGIRIASLEKKDFIEEIDTSGYDPGLYTGKMTFYYSDKEKVVSDDFRIGTLDVEIINHTQVLGIDRINKFNILVYNAWNEPIKDVYGDIEIEGVTSKTPSIDLDTFGNGVLEGYIDTTGLALGGARGSITLNFAGKSTKEEIVVDIIEDFGEDAVPAKIKTPRLDPTTLLIGSVLLVLIIIVIINIILLRKFAKDKKKR